MRLAILCAVFLIIQVEELACASSIYVSPDPNEFGTGSAEQPLSLVEAIRLVGSDGVSELVLLDGYYVVDHAIELSASPVGSIVIRALNPGRVVLGGAKEVSLVNCTLDDGIVVIGQKNADSNLRDLYVGKKRAIRARSSIYTRNTPDFSAIPGITKLSPEKVDSVLRFDDGLEIIDDTGTVELSSIESEHLEFVFRCAWWEKRVSVQQIKDGRIEMSSPAWETINEKFASENVSRLNWRKPKKCFLEGSISLLDSTGEWAIDEGSLKLKIDPVWYRENVNVYVPQLETILRVENSKNISFVGIEFAYTTWKSLARQNGFNEGQANFEQKGMIGRPPAAVEISESSNIQFQNCVFRNLGGIGLSVVESSNEVDIRKCRFEDIAGNGIVVGGIDQEGVLLERPGVLVNNIEISDCFIYNVASVYRGGVGVFVGFSTDVHVLRNEICHLPYTGISIGWGWGVLNDREVKVKGHVVEGNHIHHYLQSMYDGGGIYSLGPQSNSILGLDEGLLVRGNYIHSQGGQGNVIYTDGGSRWVSIERNFTRNNLRELDLYFDGRDRYVADWGGCETFGDLRFVSNSLGNAAGKSPNFRCGPLDPKPWAENAVTLPRVQISGNTFSQTDPVHDAFPIFSDPSSGNFPVLEKLTLNLEKHHRGNTFIEFELLSTANLIGLDLAGCHWRIEGGSGEVVPPLDSGVYRLTRGRYSVVRDEASKEFFGAISFKVEGAEFGSLSWLKAWGGDIEIDLGGSGISPILFSSIDSDSIQNSLSLYNSDNHVRRKVDSWLADPYKWQALRGIIDAGFAMPGKNTAAFVEELQAGRYTVAQSESRDGGVGVAFLSLIREKGLYK